ncbi:uncharacterized protein [Pseudorasbora parva]|uniref:uncharacterized protein isoform X2 n=1 Tax=Pseudorasbora parva TaxID=51549 RepID=UPI00351E86E6
MQNMILLFLCWLMDGVFGSETNETKAVMEGDSVTLHTNLTEIQNNDRIMWMFGPKDSVLMQTTRMDDLTSFFVNDDSGFRGRLQVDQKTGSLTIRNARIRHSGQYKLTISRENTTTKIFNVTVYGVSGADIDEVSLMEGDSVILNTDLKTDQQDRIRWYFNEIRMALISGDQSKICADDQCKERFRDRLKLDHQTGSLTIMNIKSSDTGLYEIQKIPNPATVIRDPAEISTIRETRGGDGPTVSVMIKKEVIQIYNRRQRSGVPDVEMNKMKTNVVKEGESVIFDLGEIRKPNDVMMWYFNDTCIAKITRNLSYNCKEVQCPERFRDRLKLDHQTGSLTITNITNTDTGLYKLLINRDRFSITKIFNVALNDSHVDDKAERLVLIYPLLLAIVAAAAAAAAAGLIYSKSKH